MVDIKLGLQQKQELKMTADLRQAIEMLQLSALDIQALVRQELADNPCLEVADGADNGMDEWKETSAGTSDEGDWDATDWEADDRGDGRGHEQDSSPAEQFDDGTRDADRFFELDVSDGGMEGPSGFQMSEGGEAGWENMASQSASLADHLTAQLDQMVRGRGEGARLRLVGRYLIDGLDEAGYLRLELAEVADRLNVPEDVVDDARALIQMMDPLGVGARDLPECLRLQLHARGRLDAAAEACLVYLDRVAARDWAFLAKKAGCGLPEVVDAVDAIRACNPKPGLSFGTSGRGEVVVPDVVVVPEDSEAGRGWRVELNGAAFPRLLAQPFSMGGLGSGKAAEAAKKYATENYGKAKWLIGALEQRAANILKVSRAIVAAQGQFFEAGPEFLVPLTMRQVAERVGVHESTVSRVSRGKYMQTPLGVFEFTHFFASGIGTTGGSVAVASNSVQSMIARLVKAEDPKKPLSDEQIVLKLKDEGIEIARRTVAKYRGILNIPGTSERRVR